MFVISNFIKVIKTMQNPSFYVWVCSSNNNERIKTKLDSYEKDAYDSFYPNFMLPRDYFIASIIIIIPT